MSIKGGCVLTLPSRALTNLSTSSRNPENEASPYYARHVATSPALTLMKTNVCNLDYSMLSLLPLPFSDNYITPPSGLRLQGQFELKMAATTEELIRRQELLNRELDSDALFSYADDLLESDGSSNPIITAESPRQVN